MDVRYLVLSLFFLASCMPSPTVSEGRLSNSSTTSGTNSGATNQVPANVVWNYLGKLTTSITINVSNLNNAYLVGTPVENYLSDASNFSNTDYCLVSSYSVGGLNHELRSRVVPISYYDFASKRIIKNFRIDFQDTTNSSSICSKQTKVRNTSGDYVSDPTTPVTSSIHYDSSQICLLCANMLIASRVRIFKVDPSSMNEIPGNLINTTNLTLQVDPNYSATASAGTCTNAECRSRGFDCCLENQCVRDGTQKPAASSTYSALFATAEKERLQNPLAYLNYPQIYYICGSSVPTSGAASEGSSSSTSAQDAIFSQLKKDLSCIEHLKSQSTATPFHNEVLSKTYIASTDCLTASGDMSETFYYKNVLKRLYSTCGCSRTDLSDMIISCPAYDYVVSLKDTSGQPARIDCYTPPQIPSVPLQQTISVSSRSAPHRFFDQDGIEKSPSEATQQEGDLFEYLDEGKVLPVQKNFSMNAILGQMSVTLDKALPAKTVPLELDQVYLISTTSGYYTPCPTCARDSWLGSFTAFPSSANGAGLQAVGHTTQRDELSTNMSSGNYEDTIFGRACWLPPTMIPFSHSSQTTAKDQRQNRLQTQSALFVNGYQRDWFGFNKNALIGSFDGISWFAIGKGRIVRSTSKKLFLAINAPFADLAAPTMHVVRVAAYDGITQAAQVDYDPSYHQFHPYQNEAGNCQKYHMCSTDSECITQLGWEYVCADVKDLVTSWPEFDVNGNEKASSAISLTLSQILQQKRFPTASTKRCMYRGAGSICHTNVSSLLSTDLNKTKILTCAPNFYCASTGSSGVYNNKIARYAAPLEEIPVSRNHFIGKDANILGRPHDYFGTGSLTSSIKNTINSNLSLFESSLSTNSGLCRPGKGLPTASVSLDPFAQHKSADSLQRSDYVSQIGSCHSTLFNSNRHTSCPVLGSDGNYEIFSSSTLFSGFNLRASAQNACGLETLLSTANLSSNADTLQMSSPFKSIEARPLNSQIIVDPTFARDACFRRAGAVCHTDLDCTPNKMHANQADLFTTSFFGNEAEKNYWSEYLICGQATPIPLPSSPDAFKNYDMTKNRCCREIGKDLTTYTADLAVDTFVSSSKPYQAISTGLKMSLQPGTAPNDPKRYSRLATVENIGSSIRPSLTANIDRVGNVLSQSTNISTKNQWRTLKEANSESCCGGGWIRKFSDGSNDWTKRDRLVLDVNHFKCINSRTPLITNPEDLLSQYSGAAGTVSRLVSQDYGDFCKDNTNTNGACAQYSIINSSNDTPPTAGVPYGTITINTITPDYTTAGNPDFYFQPRSADENPKITIDTSVSSNSRTNIAIKLPSYVSNQYDAALPVIKLVSTSGAEMTCVQNSSPPSTYKDALTGASEECYYHLSTGRTLKVWMTSGAWSGVFDDKLVGLKMTVGTPGTGLTRQNPGSSAFYLKRLGRLELSGIPQITFEALTCNDNANRLVQGIFKTGITLKSEFDLPSFSFTQSYEVKDSSGVSSVVSRNFTNQYGLQHSPVFSENDFKCCSPLGSTVTDVTKCCSGYGLLDGNSSQRICGLPNGTDLMVYFNSFVSNEGRLSSNPGGGLVDTDFEEQTGEPKIISSVNDKIRAMGEAYCASGSVRQGGAFGNFIIEPQGNQTNLTNRIYNILDSIQDIGQNSNAGSTSTTGYPAFVDGFRWNHHLYCNDGP